jgi:hypothetical protein
VVNATLLKKSYGNYNLRIKKKVLLARDTTEQETARIILQFEQQILDLVRERQLHDSGVDGKNSPLKPLYAAITIDHKVRNSQRFDHVTLRDTGKFYKSFQTDYGSFELEIFATNEKTPKITEVYGDNIFLLTTENEKVLSETIIRPNLLKYFKTIFK